MISELVSELFVLTHNKSDKEMFIRFEVRVKKKTRKICAPTKEIRVVHRKLLMELYDIHKFDGLLVTAYRPGISVMDTAIAHKNNKYMISYDFSKYFDTIPDYLIRSVLANTLFVDYSEDVIDTLMMSLIDEKTNGLCQGSPLSGIIANIVIEAPAMQFREIIKNELGYSDASVTFYSDDLTISSNEDIRMDSSVILSVLGDCLINHTGINFEINKRKTRCYVHNNRRVLGMTINHNNKVTVSRNEYRNLRSVLHRYVSSNSSLTMSMDKFRGRLLYALNVDETGKIANIINNAIDINEKKMFRLIPSLKQ